MPVTINGTTGIAGVDGSASTPAVQGSDTNTGEFFPAADTIAWTTGGSERMRVDSSGNVGIGTSSPTTYFGAKTAIFGSSGTNRLSVANSGATGSDASDLLVCANGTTYFLQNIIYGNGVALTQSNTTNTYTIGTSASAPLLFQTNSAERMRIDSSGQLILKRTAAVNAATIVCSTGQNSRQVSFVNNNNNNEVGYIFCNNDGTTTQYATTSDYRLKENVQPITTGLATISSLKPVTYDWIDNNSKGEGFIAHELQEHIPLAVNGTKDEVNEEGKPVYQGVDYSKIVVHLVAAVQELSAKVDAQAAEIAALKAAKT